MEVAPFRKKIMASDRETLFPGWRRSNLDWLSRLLGRTFEIENRPIFHEA